ncbi:family 78 glycoside hydrolase catalytic domain [Paenibacillus sp. UNC451MF]|uniref:family 78 glycoside hydrolase catalytic domain n=1 Tax=Paenibacillus sp. UNC451MF TaxID=1449063 RepID=UPI00056A9239|nr:family 78 glycoside hydrolase catalytic domain [Paenibacillus sp. UNC451MF]
MTREREVDWSSYWIWSEGEESPRNEWRCFRKTFEVSEEGWTEAELSITADSRYILYINGERIGRGPVRCWPHEQAYDTYDVRSHLISGQTNTIAVLVMHFGISNFYYIRGRGGLLVQLDWSSDSPYGREEGRIVTDSTWLTSRHLGNNPFTPRMSIQQAFSEWIDARKWDDGWTLPAYDARKWEAAAVIGSVGMEPWVRLKPRDIPFLTEERVYPSRIESLHRVEPIPWTVHLDSRNILAMDSLTHGNANVYAGYLGTVIRTTVSAKAVIGIAYAPPHWQAVCLNGVRYPKSAWKGNEQDRYLDIELMAGDNVLLFELAGNDHGRGLFIGIDCDEPFEAVAPPGTEGAVEGYSSFVSVGPFVNYEYIDHQVTEEQKVKQQIIAACSNGVQEAIDRLSPDALNCYEAFCHVRSAATTEQLAALGDAVGLVESQFVSTESVYVLTLWKKYSSAKQVPSELQQAIIPHALPGTVPLYDSGDTELVIDFGNEWSGYLSFEVDAEEGTELDFFGVEYMLDGKVHYTHYLDNSLRYVCREGRQSYTSAIRRGFRYLIVTVRKARRPVQLYGISVLQSNFPVTEVGRFHSSDALLNDIWEMSRHTTRLCMEDTYVDCPAYEQTFWVGDSRNEALISYYVYGAEALVKHCLDLVPGSAFQTPLYADQVPSGWNSVIPNWTFFWAIACNEYVLRTGDRDYARSIWPHVKFTLEHYLMHLNKNGLLEIDAWNFLDWAPMDQPRHGVVTHQNMFLVKALRHAAELAASAGVVDEGKSFSDQADALKQAIDTYLWSEEREAYLDCIHASGRKSGIFSMQTQVVAYLCDIAAGERKKKLEQYLSDPPESFVQMGSPFMSFFYYEALVKMGNTQRLIEDIRTQYAAMLRYGATTCWEMYPKPQADPVRPHPSHLTRSHCHAWSAAPGFFLGTSVLGVNPAAPGWREIVIAPQPCGLEWARGSVPLPDEGRIDVSWRIGDDGSMYIQAWVPAGIKAEIRLPDGRQGTTELHRVGE